MAAGSKQLCQSLQTSVEFDIPEKLKAKVAEPLAWVRVLRLHEMKCPKGRSSSSRNMVDMLNTVQYLEKKNPIAQLCDRNAHNTYVTIQNRYSRSLKAVSGSGSAEVCCRVVLFSCTAYACWVTQLETWS